MNLTPISTGAGVIAVAAVAGILVWAAQGQVGPTIKQCEAKGLLQTEDQINKAVQAKGSVRTLSPVQVNAVRLAYNKLPPPTNKAIDSAYEITNSAFPDVFVILSDQGCVVDIGHFPSTGDFNAFVHSAQEGGI